ncbi:piggyBac transposable element-derived protein 4-like [Vespa crabro]|uniref:piggyBac transposable element-derived protein 4-like n=1 Tax=Vespa crabro TaxID=7445 RepID=UPI001F022027|nr:piggyBac transposable element-derived protein 4-like [Vespa crabro]
MSGKRMKKEQCIKGIIDSKSDSDKENKYNLAYRKRRRYNPVFSTSESEEAEKPELRIDTPSSIKWTSKKPSPKIHDFTSHHSGVVGDNLNHSSKILDYFRLLFSEDLVKFIVERTNNYWCRQLKRDQLDASEEMDVDELYCFIAASLLMTRIKKISLKEYWSEDKLLRSDIFSQIMSKDRYFSLLKMLHFSDKASRTADRLYKINKVVDMLRVSFNNAFQPYQRLCIDESLLLYKGRLSLKQYIRSKNNRFGIKSFLLCDCKTGYIQDIIIYCKTDTTVATKYQYIGKPGNIVMSLLQPFLNKGHTIYLDNWFSSPILFNLLHKNSTNACGTVQRRQKELPKITDKLEKGEAVFRSSENLLAMKWCDRKEFYMLSTIHTVEFAEVPKKSKKNEVILKPKCIIDYISSMDTIDKSDIAISTVDATCKSLKWYRKYFFHLIDICVWNAFCLYKHITEEQISMAKFHLQLIKEILEKYHKNHEYHQYDGSESNYPTRLIGKHFPTVYQSGKKNRKRRCVVCTAGGIRRESKYHCEQCNVGLCVSPCFENYHTKLQY